jgi:hypothetical protein
VSEASRWRINTPAVVHENIEGEVVIIAFDTGTYYSLGGVGAAIWGALDRGLAADAIVAEVRSGYHCEGHDVTADVHGLIARLKGEQLIVPASPDAAGTAAGSGGGAGALPYVAPVLQTFTDMQALLLLDPIHEVDATGWPRTPGDTQR